MSILGLKEIETERKNTPNWVEMVSGDEPAVLDELVEFWTHQSGDDIRLRFMTEIDLDEIERRYRVGLSNCQVAACLRENGRLVGFFMGAERETDPGWIEGCVEIDHSFRRQGHAGAIWEAIYEFALAHNFKGVRGEVLADNEASLSMMARFSVGKPCEVSQRGDVITYSVGPGVVDLIKMDLL